MLVKPYLCIGKVPAVISQPRRDTKCSVISAYLIMVGRSSDIPHAMTETLGGKPEESARRQKSTSPRDDVHLAERRRPPRRETMSDLAKTRKLSDINSEVTHLAKTRKLSSSGSAASICISAAVSSRLRREGGNERRAAAAGVS